MVHPHSAKRSANHIASCVELERNRASEICFQVRCTFHFVELQLKKFLHTAIFYNMSAVRPGLVKNEITNVTRFCSFVNTVLDLLQKLNISSTNDFFPLAWTIPFFYWFYSVRYRFLQGSTRDFSRFFIILVSGKNIIFFKDNKIYSCNMKT